MSSIPRTHAVADTGATSIFIMKGTAMRNVYQATQPLTINLPDGKMVKSTHLCGLMIPGLPTLLEGHIVPDLTVTSLVGIHILCKAGCIVVFMDTACYVMYAENYMNWGQRPQHRLMDTTHNTGCYHVVNEPKGTMDHPRDVLATRLLYISCRMAPLGSKNCQHTSRVAN